MSPIGKTTALFFVFLNFQFSLTAQPLRSLDDIFPYLLQDERRSVFSADGLKRTFDKNESPYLIPASGSGIDLLGAVMEKNPSHFIEALLVVPNGESQIGLLDAYNAIGRIKNIKDHRYPSSRNRSIVIFRETTRIESASRKTPIPDPPPSLELPAFETMYLLLDDASYGSLYIRGELLLNEYGLTYNMTNFEAVKFLFFTLMGEEKFTAVIYVEPIQEGLMVYGIAGIDLPNFIAALINVSSDIERRFTVLVNWLIDGLQKF